MPAANRRAIVGFDRVVCDSLPRLYRHPDTYNLFEVMGDPPIRDAKWALSRFRGHARYVWEVILLVCRDYPNAEVVAWKWLRAEGIRPNGIIVVDDQEVADRAIIEHRPLLLIDDFMSGFSRQTPVFLSERYEKFRGEGIMVEVFRNNWRDIAERYVLEMRRYAQRL